MDQHANGKQPELKRLNYNELKDYVREKGYDINLTQKADEIRAQVEAIEAKPEAQASEPKPIQSDTFKVAGDPPSHPKLEEWLASLANRYGITRFEYTPKFVAFKLFRKESRKPDDNGKMTWQADPQGQERHFEWVGLHELAVTFGEMHFDRAPKAKAKYQSLNKRQIQIKQFI